MRRQRQHRSTFGSDLVAFLWGRAILSGEIHEGQEVTANVSKAKIFFENITSVSNEE